MDSTGKRVRSTTADRALPPGVLIVMALTASLLLLVAARYGWHRDELYFLEAGRHLAWGYVDQPPFTPLLARLADTIAPGNLLVLRIAPALATAGTVATGSLFVRELGGDRRRQVLGAVAVAAGAFTLGIGHLLSTATFDLLAWSVVLWLTARLLRTGDCRLWPVIGAVAGLALLNKNLIVVLFIALAVGVLLERRWDLLRTWWLPVGIALTLAIAAPHLLWQAANGWPQFAMAQALAERIGTENRALLLPMQVLLLGPLLVPALVRGVRWLATAADGRIFRPLLWAWPVGLVLVLVTGGRPYYVLPLTVAVALAGIAATGVRRITLALTAAVALPIALPLLPVAAIPVVARANASGAESVGWPELADQVTAVVRELPADERERVILLSASYGEAGAIDRFGPDRGLPPAYSPHNAYADFRRPTDPDATVVAIRFARDGRLPQHFAECSQVATIDNRLGIDNEAQGQPILVCRGLRGTWPEVWEQLRHIS
ncbi:ArnT family glycosyltransferase [Granulicoccus phenolivorans]|uniref:ArnT family glycosyltransferase n=1 Tax=Granulicoccus phenolivorans TaxID=266854 RepID=UPI00041EB307|nr:glycosyltransferase family 39 protein [Granulicoccus phenolivorans]